MRGTTDYFRTKWSTLELEGLNYVNLSATLSTEIIQSQKNELKLRLMLL